MGNKISHTKMVLTSPLLYRPCNDVRRGPFAGERQIVELIDLGAPLPGILNQLCTTIDSQVGNVVSLVLLPDEQEYDLFSITRAATQFGLNVFSSSSILSRDRILLGTLQIYCCDHRRPNRQEAQLIARVIRLAAIAFQRREDAGEVHEELEAPEEQSPRRRSRKASIHQLIFIDSRSRN